MHFPTTYKNDAMWLGIMGNFHTKSKQSKNRKVSGTVVSATGPPPAVEQKTSKVRIERNEPVQVGQGQKAQKVDDTGMDKHITINTYWRNLPPIDTNVYWMYSARNDVKSYHFMSAADCATLEKAFWQGKQACALEHGDGVRINFQDMVQYTHCGDCHRIVQRLTKERYDELKREYRSYFEAKPSHWVLDCKSGYILFTPEYQDIINIANDKGQNVKIQLNQCYDYTIDPYKCTQLNNVTGKERKIDRVKLGFTSKPIFGSFMVKYEARTAVTEPETGTGADPDPSIMEESCIYPQRESSSVPDYLRPTDHDPLEESCIYPATHVPNAHGTKTDPPTPPEIQYHDAEEPSTPTPTPTPPPPHNVMGHDPITETSWI